MHSESLYAKTEIRHGVSVVICCHNSSLLLPMTLKHIIAQEVPERIPWEVIMIDNSSADETIKIARESWPKNAAAPLKIVTEELLGLSHARHRGLVESKYEFISFIDDDNWISPDWVKTAFEIMTEHPEVGACGGLNKPVFEINPPEWFDRFSNSYAIGPQGDGSGYIPENKMALRGAGLVIRRTAWQNIITNGFCHMLTGRKGKHLNAGEDSEITKALIMFDWKLWYEPRLQLEHFISAKRMDWRTLRSMKRGFGRSEVILGIYDYFINLKNSGSLSKSARLTDAIKFIFHLNFRIFNYMLLSCEGDKDCTRFDFLLGSISERIRLGKRYDIAFKKIEKLYYTSLAQ